MHREHLVVFGVQQLIAYVPIANVRSTRGTKARFLRAISHGLIFPTDIKVAIFAPEIIRRNLLLLLQVNHLSLSFALIAHEPSLTVLLTLIIIIIQIDQNHVYSSNGLGSAFHLEKELHVFNFFDSARVFGVSCRTTMICILPGSRWIWGIARSYASTLFDGSYWL